VPSLSRNTIDLLLNADYRCCGNGLADDVPLLVQLVAI